MANDLAELVREALVSSVSNPPRMSYCDYIAHRIKEALSVFDRERIIEKVDAVRWDLHPEGGYLLTTKKTIQVTDRAGSVYQITVENVAEAARPA